MQKILNQEEIDALFRRALGTKSAKQGGDTRHVTPCDFRSAGQITKDQLRLLTGLHETFARNLGHSLSAYFRIELEMAVVSVEQLTYAEFLQRMPDATYYGSLKVGDLEKRAGMTIELPIAFPILDLLLGGRGRSEVQLRQLTEIEEEIFASVLSMIVKELSACWKSMGLNFTFEGRVEQAVAADINSPTERILTISFELRMLEMQATLNIIFPSAVSVLMQRALQKSSRRGSNALATEHLRNRLLHSEFQLELAIPPAGVRAKDLLDMEVGSVLALPHKVQEPVSLTVAGSRMFQAFPVAKNEKRAGYIQRVTPIYDEERGRNGFE
ncbi:MAG TPA: FliM/FliN family flagellar motor switch protein [Candidatus Angelobacter sp.]|nr:FliM/FliN family flagellar motor switch protein [Candidatus Angelobacter sp.]